FRPRRQVSCTGERAVHALLSGGHSAVSVSPLARAGRRVRRPAQPLLDLWQPGGGTAPERYARNGTEPPVAGSAPEDLRSDPDGCPGHSRLLRAVAEMA